MVTLSTSTPVVMQASGIHKSFLRGKQSSHVLRGVDVDIRQGECVFLVGPSGSGKSTLLAILGCILSPDTGDVRLLGQNIAHLNSAERTLLRRDKIGFVFQRFHLVRGLTALENVSVPLLLCGEGEHRARERGRELLAEVGLEEHMHADPRRMSSGQCQRVAIARALVADPELIFADEPTASLDEASGQQAMALLARLAREKGKTAIVVTHDPRIYKFADRILQMQEGILVPQGVRGAESFSRGSARSEPAS
jgi:putative ABC transport system ATP-binding protein